MHHSHIVALPGDIDAEKLAAHLDDAMAPFDENLVVELHRDTSNYAEPFADQLAKAKASKTFTQWGTGLTDAEIVDQWNGGADFDTDGWPLTTSNPEGHWDYWRVGGRWAGDWVLKPGAEAGPLQAGRDWDSPPSPDHARSTADSARKNALEPESIRSPYSWLDLNGQWHDKWIGPTREEALSPGMPDDTSHWERDEAEHAAEFFAFLAALPANTWLVHVDCHN